MKITHSGAILRYLGEKHGLVGSGTVEAEAKIDNACFELEDWRAQFLALFYIYHVRKKKERIMNYV